MKRHSLEDIWNQSLEDEYAVILDGDGYKSRLVYGVKIVRDDETTEVVILNTMRGGNYYSKINPQELEVFHKKGWRNGVYVVALSNYRTKLDSIQERIRSEVNGKNSTKTIQSYKSYRERILGRYNEIKEKLNQLN